MLEALKKKGTSWKSVIRRESVTLAYTEEVAGSPPASPTT